MSTTENLPATIPSDLERFRTVGYWLSLAESGSESEKAKGAAAALRLFYANELGLPPLAAAELSVIKGRLFVGAKLLRAMAAERGYRLLKIDSSDESCTAAVVDQETGEELGRTTFTMQDAKRAGLVRNGSAWATHPARMLWARASKFALDDYAPAVTMGIHTDDERPEIVGETGPGFSERVAGTPSEPVEDADWEPAPGRPDAKPGPKASQAAKRKIFTLMGQLGFDKDNRDQRIAYYSRVTGRLITSTDELTAGDASKVLAQLEDDLATNATISEIVETFEGTVVE